MIFWKKSLAGLRALSIVGFGLMVSVPALANDSEINLFDNLNNSLNGLNTDLYKLISGPGAFITVLAATFMAMTKIVGQNAITAVVTSLFATLVICTIAPRVIWAMMGAGS